jgi:molybdenum cofactor synthesis domain-containing protein
MELSRQPAAYRLWKQGYALARISLSDSGASGNREDRSGPRIAEIVRGDLPLCLELAFILPDELRGCKSLLCHLALELQVDLILTTGGTGVTSRDLAPEATEAVLERPLPGFEQAMLAASLAKTPHAVISRAKAGILGSSLIVNLPGSRKAVEENLAAVLPAFKHTLDKIRDDPTPCGRS